MRFFSRISTILGLCFISTFALAQGVPGGGGIPGGGGGGGLVPGIPGGGFGVPGGIIIDAQGMVQLRNVQQVAPAELRKIREGFLDTALPPEMIPATEQRTLSLKKLDETLRQILEKGEVIPEGLRYLGGLQRVDVIVFDRQNQDVLIVGPAEGFGPDPMGCMVGVNTGRPPMRLDDLVTALRTMQSNQTSIGCSIDPQADNLARLQNYLQVSSTPATVGVVRQRYQQMAQILGQQEVRIWGVPNDSHFALALVEADYRMKRISLGLDPSGVRGIRSHLSMLAPQGNSLQRWWFVPMYDPLETNQDGTVFKLTGQRAKLMSQEEISDASGNRVNSQFTRQSTQRFAMAFTNHFSELADKSPPFAELQSLYDLAVVGALIRTEGPRLLARNPFPTLMASEQLPEGKYPVPKTVPSQSTYRKAGNSLIGLIGGVTIDLAPVVQNVTRSIDGDGSEFSRTIGDGSWYGDAAPAQ